MFKKATSEDKQIIREIAKKHGVIGCAQPLHAVLVGKQTRYIDKAVVSSLVSELSSAGFRVENNQADLLVDVLMVWKAA